MILFSENIKQFEGQAVKVHINNIVYGSQVLNTKNFQPFYDDSRIGFLVGKQEIYVCCDEVQNIETGENVYIINGDMQNIVIERV